MNSIRFYLQLIILTFGLLPTLVFADSKNGFNVEHALVPADRTELIDFQFCSGNGHRLPVGWIQGITDSGTPDHANE